MADELLRQAGLEPEPPTLFPEGAGSNVMGALEGKTSYFMWALMDAQKRIEASDDRRMAAWREKMGELRGPEVSSPVIDEVQYRHEEYAISYPYREKLDEAPVPAPRRRPAWLQAIRETWLGFRCLLAEWVEPK